MTGAAFGGVWATLIPTAQTFIILPNVSSVDEGNAVVYTVTTTNVPNGTTLYYTNSGTTTGSDFDGGFDSGFFIVQNNYATFTLTLSNDATVEGSQTIIIQLRTSGYSGPVVATANTVTVSDTSIPVYTFEYLVIAGGGPGKGGGPINNGYNSGGGGGAGGYRFGNITVLLGVEHVITIGAGAAVDSYYGNNGGVSKIVRSSQDLIVADGGGWGGGYYNSNSGNSGGSGGGGYGSGGPGGAGNTPATSPSQGNNGGPGYLNFGGGGGGAGQVGSTNSWSSGGDGSNSHATWAIATGTGANSGYYAGGGSGGTNDYSGSPGSLGGGGSGTGIRTSGSLYGGPGLANTGSGGGGGGTGNTNGTSGDGGPGGSGIVILRSQGDRIGLGGNVYVSNGYTYHVFKSSGTFIIPNYFIYSNVIQIFEGESITVSVQATGVSNGTVLYWTNEGTTAAEDFVGNINNGSITVNNGTATFTIQVANDAVNEDIEFVNLKLRSDSITGTVLASAEPIRVLDANTVVISYSLTSNVSTATEGQTIEFTVTSNITRPGGDLLYWTNDGTTAAADFIGNVVTVPGSTNQGTVTVLNNQAKIYLTVANDYLTEGLESIILNLRTTSYAGPIVATTSLGVTDTSSRPGWTLIPNNYIVNEGESVTYTLTTSGVTNGTTFYWTYTGSVNTSDITGGAESGSFTMNNNQGTFTIGFNNDAANEQSEYINVDVRIGSASGFVVATSSNVWVYDTAFTASSVDYLLVAGGAGGGASAGGGGGGGAVQVGTYTHSAATPYAVVIGGGGSASQPDSAFQAGPQTGGNGGNTSAFGVTALGGGGGGSYMYGPNTASNGAAGGTGGGGSAATYKPSDSFGGSGSQGGSGGRGSTYAQIALWDGGGGGGGAGGSGGSATPFSMNGGGAGGPGYTWVNGVTYGGGGGGGGANNIAGQGGAGGSGGGGAGKTGPANPFGGTDGANGLGGGGGGGGCYAAPGPAYSNYNGGGYGGSGVAIIRYRGKPIATGGTITALEGYTYHTFTGSGNWTTN